MKKKIILLSSLFILLDIVSKQIIKNVLSLGESIRIIPNFFNITYVTNDGAAFSLLKGQRFLFIILAIVFFIYLLYLLKNNRINKWYYSLLIGGILGNLFDRIIYGFVIDFLDFQIFNYNAPIFNLADTFIVICVLIILIEEVRKVIYGNKSNR